MLSTYTNECVTDCTDQKGKAKDDLHHSSMAGFVVVVVETDCLIVLPFVLTHEEKSPD